MDGPYHRDAVGDAQGARPGAGAARHSVTTPVGPPPQRETPEPTKRDETSPGEDLPTPAELILSRLDEGNQKENQRFRRFLIAALIVHAIALIVTFPELRQREIMTVGKPAKVFVMQQPKYKKPPAPPARQEQPKPKVKAKKIPIPDPTPDEPEPIEVDLPILPEVELADITEVTFGIPDAPPTDGTGISGPQDFHGDAMELGSGVARPVAIHRPQPLYTEEARQARIQGVVILQGIVDEQGLVRNLKVVKGLPLGLAESALDTAATWRFKPAVYQGRPVAVKMHFTINFTVQ
ncbi:MAG: TonB family protein [Acidobacteriota bacterium]